MYCKFCGSQIPDDAQFCPNCSRALNEAPPAAPASPPAPTAPQQPGGILASLPVYLSSPSLIRLIRIMVLTVMVCFLLPFVTVSCSSSTELSETYSGFELMTTIGSSNDKLLQESQQSGKANIYVIAAFLCAAGAAAAVYVKQNYKLTAGLSGAGAFLLILMRLTFRSYYDLNNAEIASVISVHTKLGLILAILNFLLLTAACIKLLQQQQQEF